MLNTIFTTESQNLNYLASTIGGYKLTISSLIILYDIRYKIVESLLHFLQSKQILQL